MRKKVKMHARRTLASILRKTPPRQGEDASRYCERVKYKTDIIWESKDHRFFNETLSRHGYDLDPFTDRILRFK